MSTQSWRSSCVIYAAGCYGVFALEELLSLLRAPARGEPPACSQQDPFSRNSHLIPYIQISAQAKGNYSEISRTDILR
jgi:hypothetical protein